MSRASSRKVLGIGRCVARASPVGSYYMGKNIENTTPLPITPAFTQAQAEVLKIKYIPKISETLKQIFNIEISTSATLIIKYKIIFNFKISTSAAFINKYKLKKLNYIFVIIKKTALIYNYRYFKIFYL